MENQNETNRGNTHIQNTEFDKKVETKQPQPQSDSHEENQTDVRPSIRERQKKYNLDSSENQSEAKVQIKTENQPKSKSKLAKKKVQKVQKSVPTKPKINVEQDVAPVVQIALNSQPVMFKYLAEVYDYVGRLRGQNSKQMQKDRLKSFFTQLCKKNPEDLIKAYWLSVCKIAPDYQKQQFGVGDRILVKAIATSTGRSEKQIRDAFHEVGDLGQVAADAKSSQKTMDNYFKTKKQAPSLTVDKVFSTLRSIRDTKGNNSGMEKENKIMELLRMSKGEETKFIVRFIEGNLKINAGQKTMQTALIEALFNLNYKNGTEEQLIKYSNCIKKSLSQYPNEAAVIRKLIEIKRNIHLLEQEFKITPNIPCKPMLAKPTKDISSILDRFDGKQFTCQFKYDGLRGQIHYTNGKVSVFSRNLQNMTEAYPDITNEIENSMKDSEISDFIIDSEIVAVNPQTKQLLPFQVLSTRAKKAAKLNEIQVAVNVFTFDILRLNNKQLTHLSLKKRRQYLKQLQSLLPPIVTLISSKQCANITEIDEFLALSIKEGTEGLMIKDLSTTYSCAKRSWDWVKLKKDYIDGLGDTLDVVPIGGDFGQGKRKGLYGAYLLAVYNSDLETYETLCKIGTGFSDEVLEAAFNFFKDKTVAHCPKQYRVDNQSAVNVWFTPSTVWQVKGADFQLSPIYTCGKGNVDDSRGIGLRFPRLIRVREDKKPHQCSDINFVMDLYRQQAVVQNKNKNKEEQEDDYY